MIDSMRLVNIDELFMKMIDLYDVKYVMNYSSMYVGMYKQIHLVYYCLVWWYMEYSWILINMRLHTFLYYYHYHYYCYYYIYIYHLLISCWYSCIYAPNWGDISLFFVGNVCILHLDTLVPLRCQRNVSSECSPEIWEWCSKTSVFVLYIALK